MNKKQYEAKRTALMNEAQALINAGKAKEAEEKMNEVKALDEQWDAIAQAEANFRALNQEPKAMNPEKIEDSIADKNIVEAETPVAKAWASEEYKNAWAKTLMGRQLSNKEKETYQLVNESYTHTTENTSIVIPKSVSRGIWELAGEIYPYFGEVTKTYINGLLSMIQDDTSSEAKWYDEATETEEGKETLKEFADVKAEVEKLLDVFKFRDAQKEAMNLARIGNKYLADTEPWKLAKTDMDRVATILNIALQLVANLAIAFEPFLPFSSEKLRKMLNMETFEWDQLGRTDLLAEGHQLNKAELLFEKIEDETIQAQVDKLLATQKANEAANYKANPIKPVIAFEEFEKLDIRVGTVLECEVVPKMKKLLKFKIADGLENRTIVSGIAQHYKPEELVGKQVLFIANLAPRQFKNGLVSEGMILSAENFDGTLAVTSLLREVKPGSEVK